MVNTADELADIEIDDYAGDYSPALYAARDEAVPVVGPLPALQPADLARYAAQGYLPVTNVLTSTQLRAARDGIDGLICGRYPSFRGIQWEGGVRGRLAGMGLAQRRDSVRKLIYYVDHEPLLRAIAHDPGILATVGQILDAEPELFADQALLKPPGIGREKPWHQDKAFFDIRPGARVVGLWIALDATDVGNGCMHVIGGSHRDGPVTHFNRRDFQICDSDVRRTEVTAVPLPAGGAMLFDGLIHHGTPRNSSRRRRWALQFHYTAAEAIWRTRDERERYKQSRLAAFGAEGADATC